MREDCADVRVFDNDMKDSGMSCILTTVMSPGCTRRGLVRKGVIWGIAYVAGDSAQTWGKGW